jgi:hypothetical protein
MQRTRRGVGLLASWANVQRAQGSQWVLSDLLANQWSNNITEPAAGPRSTAHRRAPLSTAAAAAAAAANAAATAPPPPPSGGDPGQQRPRSSRGVGARQTTYGRTGTSTQRSSSHGSGNNAGSAIAQLVRTSSGATTAGCAPSSLSRRPGAGRRGQSDALAVAQPIGDAALMALIREAARLSDIERALLDHGAHFRWARCGRVLQLFMKVDCMRWVHAV